MNLNEKLTLLRKEHGWSQEELGEKLSVSRQSVSKWESGQSLPDIDNIILLSEIFNVSTDYLLKNQSDDNNDTSKNEIPIKKARRITQEQADEYLTLQKKAAPRFGIATVLCILSCIPILLIPSGIKLGVIQMKASVGLAISISFLIAVIASAVVMFIFNMMKSNHFSFLDNEDFEIDDTTRTSVLDRQKEFSVTYLAGNIIGTVLCIISVIPLIVTALITEVEFYVMVALAVTLLIIALGVFSFVYVGLINSGMQKLLCEGEYTKKKKSISKKKEALASIYWTAVVAIYLGYSFITFDWGRSWIVWPVAAVLFGVVDSILNLTAREENDSKN